MYQWLLYGRHPRPSRNTAEPEVISYFPLQVQSLGKSCSPFLLQMFDILQISCLQIYWLIQESICPVQSFSAFHFCQSPISNINRRLEDCFKQRTSFVKHL